MSELEKVGQSENTLTIGGKKRLIKFGFGAWAALEKRYNGIKNISKLEADMAERPFEIIPYLIWLGLQDKEGLNEETVLDEFGIQDIPLISNVLYTALYGSLPKTEEGKK